MPTPKKATRKRDPNLARQIAFVAAYVENHSSVRAACKVAGVHRNTVLEWKKKPAFRKLMNEALKELREDLFAAVVERAKDKSDTLAIFLLKSLAPEQYDDAIRKAKWELQRGITPQSAIPERLVLVREPLPPVKPPKTDVSSSD